MLKNTAGQVVFGQLINATTGAPFAGSATVAVALDTQAQAAGTGTVTSVGNGLFRYAPSQAETNGDAIAYQFLGSGAVDATVQVSTITATQTAAVAAVTPTATTTTGTQLIVAILQRLQVLQAGEVGSPDDQALVLSRINDFIDSLGIEPLTMYTITTTSFAIVSGTATYSVGVGGAVNVSRPPTANYLEAVSYTDSTTSPALERPLTLLTDAQSNSLALKTLTGIYPQVVAYNPTMPLGTLTLWPVPTSTTLTGKLYVGSPVASVALATILQLPSGYVRMIRDNVAVEIAPDFGATVTPSLIQSATSSLQRVKTSNVRMVDLQTDAGRLFGHPLFDINRGW